jgi:transcriptional regulator with XRE-family HTH domain
MDTVGNRIRIQRTIKNYSQEYMGFMLEISQPAYSKIERDETEITLMRIYDIAEVLDVEPLSLIPPSRYGSGINYLKMKQFFYRLSKSVRNKIAGRRKKAEESVSVHSDKSNTIF